MSIFKHKLSCPDSIFQCLIDYLLYLFNAPSTQFRSYWGCYLTDVPPKLRYWVLHYTNITSSHIILTPGPTRINESSVTTFNHQRHSVELKPGHYDLETLTANGQLIKAIIKRWSFKPHYHEIGVTMATQGNFGYSAWPK